MIKKHLKDELIILRRFTVNENDLLITAFAKNLGKITLKAKGSKRINSKFVGFMEPLSLISAEIYFSGKSFTLTNANSIIDPPLEKNFETSQIICKTLLRSLPEEQSNYELFASLKEIIELCHNSIKTDEILMIFYIKYLQKTGHEQSIDQIEKLDKNSQKVLKFFNQARSHQAIRLKIPPNLKTRLRINLDNLIQETFY